MRTQVPEKLLVLANEVAESGYANITRLTVLKKWFQRSDRLVAFTFWTVNRAISRKGKTIGEAAKLFQESRALVKGADKLRPVLDGDTARALFNKLKEFQNEYEEQAWGRVRIVQNWNLFLIERSLGIYLNAGQSPPDGYHLAASYCRHYDPRVGEGLTKESVSKIREIVRWMNTIEALEDE
jgi:hypothetical protein